MADDAPAQSHAIARNHVRHGQGSLAALAVGALGVVFGDIGTSPLYTLQVGIAPEPGAASSTPSRALSTLMAGVMMPSP